MLTASSHRAIASECAPMRRRVRASCPNTYGAGQPGLLGDSWQPSRKSRSTSLTSCRASRERLGAGQEGFWFCSVADTVASGPHTGAQIGPPGTAGGCLEVTSLEGASRQSAQPRSYADGAGQVGVQRTAVDRERPPDAGATGTWRARPTTTCLVGSPIAWLAEGGRPQGRP
jgi:hypothetical protein